jgi:hypothetical protein
MEEKAFKIYDSRNHAVSDGPENSSRWNYYYITINPTERKHEEPKLDRIGRKRVEPLLSGLQNADTVKQVKGSRQYAFKTQWLLWVPSRYQQHQQILCFWTFSIVLSLSKNAVAFIFKTQQRFGDWILFPSSGKTYSVGPNRKSWSLSPDTCTSTKTGYTS